ncbi:MAG: hypothetical protein ACOC22_00485 [bacterium]
MAKLIDEEHGEKLREMLNETREDIEDTLHEGFINACIDDIIERLDEGF